MGWPWESAKPLKQEFDRACAANFVLKNDNTNSFDPNDNRMVNNALNVMQTQQPAQFQAMVQECKR